MEAHMKNNIVALLGLFFIFCCNSIKAEPGKILILSPHHFATVNQHDSVELSYEVTTGTQEDTVHLFVDGWHEGILRQLKGRANVGALKPGTHHICLTINTKEQAPTGVEECVEITSK
jgi:hypothetical protein